jgi:hypothetical protein
VVEELCPSGQVAACGAWPPLFAHVVVVVVVVVVVSCFVNPPFTGELVVTVVLEVSVVGIGSLAKAILLTMAEDARRDSAKEIVTIINVVLVFIIYYCTIFLYYINTLILVLYQNSDSCTIRC